MVFSNPIYLWGLVGLLVPLAIHLWSKKEAKTIKVGSIALLEESSSSQSRSIRINELALLLIRMMLVSTLVLLMAGPQRRTRVTKAPVAYLVEPSLLQNTGLRTVLDSLFNEVPIYLLQDDFPLWEKEILEPSPFKNHPNYWQWAKRLEELPADSLVIFTEGLQKGLRGKRPQVSKPIHWIIMDESEERIIPWQVQRNGEQGVITSLKATSNSMYFIREERSWTQIQESLNASGDSLHVPWKGQQRDIPWVGKEPFEIGVFASTAYQNDREYLKAALTALSQYWHREVRFSEIRPDSALNRRYDLMVWLDKEKMPNYDGIQLLFQEDAMAKDLIVPGTNHNEYYITAHLDAERAIGCRLPELLGHILYPPDSTALKTVQYDSRRVTAQTLTPGYQKKENKMRQKAQADITMWIWGILVLLFLAERTLAHIRKQ
jgi:hypothetical protein